MPSEAQCEALGAKVVECWSAERLPSSMRPAVVGACNVSARFVAWTMGCGDVARATNFALWLSMVWIIDGYYDKYRSKFTSADRAHLIETLATMRAGDARRASSDAFLSAIIDVYAIYLSGVAEYRRSNEELFERLNEWFGYYLDFLPVGDVPIYTLTELGQYRAWRLIDGCMMCVVWHLALYEGVDVSTCASVVERVAVAVSYHNDVLSCNRDLEDHKDNLVVLLSEQETLVEAYRHAIEITDEEFAIAERECDDIDAKCASIARRVLWGSKAWAEHEIRYERGLEILERFNQAGGITENELRAMLNTRVHAYGDPDKQ